MFVEGGRVFSTPRSIPCETGLREIAKIHKGDFRLTANQNLVIANITPANKAEVVAKLLEKYGIADSHEKSALRLSSIACVALPTCCFGSGRSRELGLPAVIILWK